MLGAPNIGVGSVIAGGSGVPESSISSIDSAGGLGLLGDETMSSSKPPNENAPEEGLSDFGPSLAAVPSPSKEEPRTKPPDPPPKGFFTSVDFGVKAESVWALAPKGVEESDAFANALFPADGFANGESPGLAAANPPNPPPPENELKPPPAEPAPVPRRLLPGVLGWPTVDPILPKPDWPNCGCPGMLGVPKACPG